MYRGKSDYELIVDAKKSNSSYWQDLWFYRELFLIFAWRDVIVRYKQTMVGILWSLIRPLLGMIIFTLVFQKIANMKSGDVPYPLMVYTGMLVWQFFSNTVAIGGESLLNHASIITKIYFPRLIIPTTGMVVSFMDFAISVLLFIPLFFYYRCIPDWKIVFFPFFIFLTILLSLGVTYMISALCVKYRDFKFVLPFALQIGIYISPVGYLSDAVPGKWNLFYSLNPLVGIMDGMRWSFFNTPLNIFSLTISIVFSLVLFFAGILVFRTLERKFADEI